MKLTGTYVVYENGVEVTRKSNTLTKFGKRFLTSYLAGATSFNSKDIAVGIGGSSISGGTAPGVNNTQLDFEFHRSPVTLGSIDIQTDPLTGESTYAVVYKTTVPNDVVGIISELGLFNTETTSGSSYASRYISSFENNLYWLDADGLPATTVSTPAPSIGNTWFKIDAASGQSSDYTLQAIFDLSGYGVNDSLSLAFKQSDTNLDYVYVRFYSSSEDYYEARFTGNTSLNKKIMKVSMSDVYGLNKVGTPNASSIISISVGAKAKSTGATSVLLDGLRVNDEDTFNTNYGLISRATLDTPIQKQYGVQTDIEYRIGLSF